MERLSTLYSEPHLQQTIHQLLDQPTGPQDPGQVISTTTWIVDFKMAVLMPLVLHHLEYTLFPHTNHIGLL